MDIIFSELPTMNKAVPRNASFNREQAKAFLSQFLRLGFKTKSIYQFSPIYLALGCQMDDEGAVTVDVGFGQNYKIVQTLSLFNWKQLYKLLTTTRPKFLHGLSMMNYMVVCQFSDESVRACYALMILWELQETKFESEYWCDDVSRDLVNLKLIEAPDDIHDYAPEHIYFNMDITVTELAESADYILYYYNQQQAIENPKHIEAHQFH